MRGMERWCVIIQRVQSDQHSDSRCKGHDGHFSHYNEGCKMTPMWATSSAAKDLDWELRTVRRPTIMSMFVLVGSKEPLYKMEMKSRKEESAHVDEFLLHSALDIVDEMMWTTQSMALKVVDKFNDQFVSAFVTATNVKFLLLHESRNEDTIKAFFHEVHELYLKLLLNPFYEYDTPIASEVFDARMKTLARRYL